MTIGPHPTVAAGPRSSWAPFVIIVLIALLCGAAFVADGLRRTALGPDKDRFGTFEAAGLVELEGGVTYGVYDNRSAGGPKNVRVDLDGELLAIEPVSQENGNERVTAGRFLVPVSGTYRVRVDGQQLEIATDLGLTFEGLTSARFSVGDDPFNSRETVEIWPFVGAGMCVIAALFAWGVGYDKTRAG